MLLDLLNSRFLIHSERNAVVENGKTFSYKDLNTQVDEWAVRTDVLGISAGTVVGVQSDFSYQTIALLISLFRKGCVVAFISSSAKQVERYCEEAFVEYLFVQEEEGLASKHVGLAGRKRHELLCELERKKRSGFIIFSSGTTGRPKAILHDLEKFLSSFESANKSFRTLAFLLLDHIAGIDTLFYSLYSGGCLVLASSRTPRNICGLISCHKIEVLPVSPSFLNLLILSSEHEEFDLSSLEIITYGSEPMSDAVLKKLPLIFPDTIILQKYGTSEFGSPRSKTREGDTSWIKLDSPNFQTKVSGGVLWVKSSSTMVGYLNADGMLESEGWLCTGDLVEVDNGWLRFIGRETDIINVGGEKVFPVEVESVVNEVETVDDCAVFGEVHALLGNQVCVKIRCGSEVDTKLLKKAIRKHCICSLERYKVPSKFEFTSSSLVNSRHKKQRGGHK